MHDDDAQRTKRSAHEVGMALDALSIEELQERIALLQAEIERLQKAIEVKSDSRAAAASVFKI